MCIEGAWAPTAEGEVDRHLRSECLTAQPPPGRPRVARAHTRHQGSSRHSRQLSPLHFMTMMLAASIAYNPLRVYNAGLQRRVPLLRRGGLRHSVAQKAPEISRQVHAAQAIQKAAGARMNLHLVSLAAQTAITSIAAVSFDQVSVIGALTNLVAVPLFSPILILGLLGSVLGNVAPTLAYSLDASNGFLVALLVRTAKAAPPLPFASITTPGSRSSSSPFLCGLGTRRCLRKRSA
jgi:competence protein ComEC